MTGADRVARRLIVRGRVQGVCFRDWTAAAARDGGLAGWVRNRADGTVEIRAEGTAAAVEAFIRAAHDGPPAARVDAVEVTPMEPAHVTDFTRRPTG